MIDPKILQQRITDALPGSEVIVASDDMVHYEAVVRYTGFKNKSLLEQHRMVYAVLGSDLQANIHAIKLKTQIPKEKTL